MRPSDDQLKAMMISALDGDAAIYAALLAMLVPLLHTFFRRRMAAAVDEIEDLVQETLIAIHTRRATYDRDRAFGPWLFAVARYKMIDHFRRTRRSCFIEGLEDVLIAEGFEEGISARMDIDRLLDELPTKQARAIRKAKIEGLSIAEVAARENIGEADVKVSIHRGLKSLAALIAGNRR